MPTEEPDKAALPFEDASSDREPATDPWSRAVPDPVLHDPVGEHTAREAARFAQMQEHNDRVGGGAPVLPTKMVGDDGLEVFEDDEVDDDDGDDEPELTAALPTDDYSQAENDHDDQPG